MNARPTYVVLAASGPSWQSHGPTATQYPTLEDAEAAARDLLARHPQRMIGVYELQSVFATEQTVVKQNVDTDQRMRPPRLPAANAMDVRMVN